MSSIHIFLYHGILVQTVFSPPRGMMMSALFMQGAMKESKAGLTCLKYCSNTSSTLRPRSTMSRWMEKNNIRLIYYYVFFYSILIKVSFTPTCNRLHSRVSLSVSTNIFKSIISTSFVSWKLSIPSNTITSAPYMVCVCISRRCVVKL